METLDADQAIMKTLEDYWLIVQADMDAIQLIIDKMEIKNDEKCIN